MLNSGGAEAYCVVPDERQKELAWAQARPTSRTHNITASHNLADPAVWEHALTDMEHRFLVEYRLRWPGSAYMLNQDPQSGHGHHASGSALFTLISSMGLFWLDGPTAGRWLLPTEALICMGSPDCQMAFCASPVCESDGDNLQPSPPCFLSFSQRLNRLRLFVMFILSRFPVSGVLNLSVLWWFWLDASH